MDAAGEGKFVIFFILIILGFTRRAYSLNCRVPHTPPLRVGGWRILNRAGGRALIPNNTFCVHPSLPLGCSIRHDTITSWESSSKTGIFLPELRCFVERECQSKPSSTIWKLERRSKSFSRAFPPYRVKPLSLLSNTQDICYSHGPKCAS